MNKDKNIIQLRGLETKAIQDVDLEKRKVSGYFASFNTIDSHQDIIMRGAFAKSIMERGVNASGNRRIAHLWQHEMDQPIGKLLELREDDFGLFFVSELINTQKGSDVLTMYQEGVIREHSIGFNYISDKMEWVEDDSLEIGGYWEIREVKLFEGSSVTFGSNEHTPYLGSTKSLTKEQKLEKLNADLTANVKLIKGGKGSDELLASAEYNIKLIQRAYNDLLNTPSIEAVKNTLKQEPKKEGSNFFSHLVKGDEEKHNFFNHLNTGK